MTDSKRTLATKLAEVAAEVAHVGKDGENAHFKYRFTSAGAVLAKVNPALSSRGVATTSRVEVESRIGQLVTVRVITTFTDGDTGEQLVSEALGSGTDSGDKAVMKAQTAAQKYLLKLAFNIDFGDDPEADARTDKATAPKAAPVARPGAAPAAPPKQQQVSGTAASLTFKFGPGKNLPIGEQTLEQLDYYRQYISRQIGDPAKANFATKNKHDLEAIDAVMTDKLQAAGSDLPSNGADGLFGDDEMPV